MWFGQTGLNINRLEIGLSASVNGALSHISCYDLYHTAAQLLWSVFGNYFLHHSAGSASLASAVLQVLEMAIAVYMQFS